MLIIGKMKLADVIHHDYNLVPVINRFGISLGFGDNTIEEICADKKINSGFFLTILNTFHDKQYFSQEYFKSFSAETIIKYLRKAHAYYLDRKIPEIKQLIHQLGEMSKGNKETIKLIADFFDGYASEFSKHVEREEKVVYPYALLLGNSILDKNNAETKSSEIGNYSISLYEENHEDIEEKLYDLKNLLIKYMPSASGDIGLFEENTYLLLREIFVLEKELNEHSRIEDLILVPKVREMEKLLKTQG
jgi:regulator of cell morphogenesis and NO signaling